MRVCVYRKDNIVKLPWKPERARVALSDGRQVTVAKAVATWCCRARRGRKRGTRDDTFCLVVVIDQSGREPQLPSSLSPSLFSLSSLIFVFLGFFGRAELPSFSSPGFLHSLRLPATRFSLRAGSSQSTFFVSRWPHLPNSSLLSLSLP